MKDNQVKELLTILQDNNLPSTVNFLTVLNQMSAMERQLDAALTSVGGLFVVSTSLILNAGDTVSLINVAAPQFTVELLGPVNNTGTPTGTPTGLGEMLIIPSATGMFTEILLQM